LQPSKFKLLDLKPDGPPENPRDVHFPKLTERFFTQMDMSDIMGRMNENVYFRPSFPNFKSVESFAIVKRSILLAGKPDEVCIVAFQATVSGKHELKRAGLKDIQEKVKTNNGCELELFVVFVTNAGKGISKPQSLGKDVQAKDADYLQFVLLGMALEGVVMTGIE
jgi:hypothetical protein